MNYYPFNSRNSLYKSPLGAVASTSPLMLRLLLHKDARVKSAFLCITKDGEDLVEYQMTAEGEISDYLCYEYTLSLSVGIYWYYFRYESDFGTFYVSKQNKGNGVVTKTAGTPFQQTVYSPDFKAPDYLKGGIIYQIFPDRFYSDGIKNADKFPERAIRNDWGGVPYYKQDGTKNSLSNDYFGGNLTGITEKLPYLKSLGVSVIYLNPIFEAHSNHRYNTADYMKIDPILGNEKDFCALCDAAHSFGIKIILDGVFSHTGDDSIYFDKYGRYGGRGAYSCPDSPYKSWYKFYGSRDEYDSWWGVKSLPEVNEENESYLDFICGENGVLAHWLKLGADGWRLDVADELPDVFLDTLRETVKKVKPDAFILGEVWEDASNKISYGRRRKYLLGGELDSVMNYPFANGIINYIKTGNAELLSETVEEICENYPAPALNTLMNHLGTHDTARILSVMGKKDGEFGDREAQANTPPLTEAEKTAAVRRLKAAAVIQYTLSGIPSLYYGDEAGAEGLLDPFCRGCYPWGSENTELLDFYKALGGVRRALLPLKSGVFRPFIVRNGLFSFTRKSSEGTVLVAVNSGQSKEEITLPDGFKRVFGKVPENNRAELFTYEYLIAEKKNEG